jgi:hypothetical protein
MTGKINPFDRPVAEFDLPENHVLIICPACGASETADAAVLADAPMIVCRNCGETWPVGPKRRKRDLSPALDEKPGGGTSVIDAEKRPLIAYSDGAEKAWQAKIDGDILPEQPEPGSRVPGMIAMLAAVLFGATFLGGREAAVAALPDLAGLYEAVGLPVNLDGLAIEDVEARRSEDGNVITVQGLINNVSGVEQPARPLVVTFVDAGALAVESRDFNPPAATILPGEESPFTLELADPPEGAATVTVRFRRASEPLPGGASDP